MTKKPHSITKKPTKSNLPSKPCLQCARPFDRRKKRERSRDEIKFCSEQCKSAYKKNLNNKTI